MELAGGDVVHQHCVEDEVGCWKFISEQVCGEGTKLLLRALLAAASQPSPCRST
jgi:hypothetical protein